jgi:hypothetical protein
MVREHLMKDSMADVLKRAREKRRAVLQAGLLACYEIIDRIRKEIAELDEEAKRG